ncbi:MAG TPA: DnaJ domain-containing protein [Cytophagaceae bacterium]|jgi:curved DNA-binding protein CbpA|nr:DnaJ domain-containing protein [Cytophagaceae bacterium]
MSFTLYDILGVSSSASTADIKATYKKLAKQYHPDKNPGSTWHEDQFKRINQAYQILSNPIQRRIYDDRLEYEIFHKQKPKTNPNPPPPRKKTTAYKRPVYTEKKPYEIIISNKKLNLIILGYYLIAIVALELCYQLIDYQKTRQLFVKAQEYEKRGQFDEAIRTYAAIIAMNDGDDEAYEKRGIVKLKAGSDIQDALDDFSDAIDNTRNPSDTLVMKHAKCHFNLQNYSLALVDFESILNKEDSPQPDSFFYYKATCNFFLAHYQAAISDYSKFIQTTPNSGEAHFKRGFCYYQIKDYKNALPDYNYTIKWQPENGENYYYRGFIKFALKDSINGCMDITDAFLLGFSEAGEAMKKHCQ